MDRRLFLTAGFAAAATAAPDGPPTPAPPPEPAAAPGDDGFEAWKAAFIAKARAREVPAELLERELKDLRPDPKVLVQDVGQPELSKPFGDYIKATVSEERISQ